MVYCTANSLVWGSLRLTPITAVTGFLSGQSCSSGSSATFLTYFSVFTCLGIAPRCVNSWKWCQKKIGFWRRCNRRGWAGWFSWKSKESAVWLHFTSGWREGLDLRLNKWQIVRSAEKVLKWRREILLTWWTTWRQSILKYIYEEVRQKTDENFEKNNQGVSLVCWKDMQQSLLGIAAKKSKLNSSSTLQQEELLV